MIIDNISVISALCCECLFIQLLSIEYSILKISIIVTYYHILDPIAFYSFLRKTTARSAQVNKKHSKKGFIILKQKILSLEIY